MAFIRYKGNYAYLVENERVRDGDVSQVRQRVLYYFGRTVEVNDAVKDTVARRFPDARVDWEAIGAAARPVRRPSKRDRRATSITPIDEEWLSWD